MLILNDLTSKFLMGKRLKDFAIILYDKVNKNLQELKEIKDTSKSYEKLFTLVSNDIGKFIRNLTNTIALNIDFDLPEIYSVIYDNNSVIKSVVKKDDFIKNYRQIINKLWPSVTKSFASLSFYRELQVFYGKIYENLHALTLQLFNNSEVSQDLFLEALIANGIIPCIKDTIILLYENIKVAINSIFFNQTTSQYNLDYHALILLSNEEQDLLKGQLIFKAMQTIKNHTIDYLNYKLLDLDELNKKK